MWILRLGNNLGSAKLKLLTRPQAAFPSPTGEAESASASDPAVEELKASLTNVIIMQNRLHEREQGLADQLDAFVGQHSHPVVPADPEIVRDVGRFDRGGTRSPEGLSEPSLIPIRWRARRGDRGSPDGRSARLKQTPRIKADPAASAKVPVMTTMYQTSRDSKTLEIESSTRDGLPFRMVLTLRKLGVVTMLDCFLSGEEAEGIIEALSKSKRVG